MIVSECIQGSEQWEKLRRGKLTASEFHKVLGSKELLRARVTGKEPDPDGFGRAHAQEEAYETLKAAPGGVFANEVSASALTALVEKGLAEKYKDPTGCTLKVAAAQDHIDFLSCQTTYTDAELGIKPPFEAMERGKHYEGAARFEFTNLTGESVREVGFVMHEELNLVGASPDGLTSPSPKPPPLEIKCFLPQNHRTLIRKGILPTEHKPQVHGQIAICDAPHGWFVGYCPNEPTLVLKVERDGYTENLLSCLKEFEALYLRQLDEYAQIVQREEQS